MVPAWIVAEARLDERVKAQATAAVAEKETQERALQVALTALGERLAAHNEILAAWKVDREGSMSRAEIDARIKPLEAAVADALSRRTAANESRTGLRLDTGWAVGVGGLALAVVMAVTR